MAAANSPAVNSKIGAWSSALGAGEQPVLIVVDKLLDRLSASKLKPILNSCVPDSGFVAFRPFLRHSLATVVFDGSTEKAVVSAGQKLMETDGDAENKFVVDLLGLPGCLLMAYRMHAVAAMAPHDWWNCIVQCISQQVHLEHRVKRDDPNVISGLQQTNTTARVCKPTVHTWLREMETAVHRRMAHKTELPALLQRSFSTSTEVSDLGNLNAAICAFKYRFVPDCDSSFRDQNFLCGLYGIRMLGSLEDWQQLRHSFNEVCAYLKASSEDYGIETPWMEGVQTILEKLVITYEHQGRSSIVRRFWKSMLTCESANCEKGSELQGWLSFLFSCKIIDNRVDLKAVPTAFSISCLPFTTEAFGCTADYELCTGIVGYSMKFDREYDRWLLQPRHECCLFKY